MVRKYIRITLQIEGNPFTKAQIEAQPHAAGNERTAIPPKVTKSIACIVEGDGFVVVKTMVVSNPSENIRAEKTVVTITANQLLRFSRASAFNCTYLYTVALSQFILLCFANHSIRHASPTPA